MPLIVIVLANQLALVPDGKPLAAFTPSLLIPVASVVVWVIFVNGVFIQSVGLLDAAEAVLSGFTTIVPVAFTIPHPPVIRIL